MSAFIVNHTHINALVKFACINNLAVYDGRSKFGISGNEDAAAQMLLDENTRSVNFRYSLNNEADKIIYQIDAPHLSPIEAIKAAECLDYQSCETLDWDETLAKKILKTIINCAISRLPGYEQANWHIRDHCS